MTLSLELIQSTDSQEITIQNIHGNPFSDSAIESASMELFLLEDEVVGANYFNAAAKIVFQTTEDKLIKFYTISDENIQINGRSLEELRDRLCLLFIRILDLSKWSGVLAFPGGSFYPILEIQLDESEFEEAMQENIEIESLGADSDLDFYVDEEL